MCHIFSAPSSAHATAGSLSALSDTMGRLQISPATSSHSMRFTTSVSIQGAGDTIVTTFPSDFTLTSKAIASVTFTHGASTGVESTEVLAAAADATKWGAAFSGTANRTFTLTAPTDGVGAAAVAANDKIVITLDATNCLNPTVAGNYAILIAVAGSNTANGEVAVAILNSDQVSVSGTVDPILSFSISNLTVGFGHINTTAVRWATTDQNGATVEPANGNPTTLTGGTNAASGWSMTVQDQGNGSSAGLYSSSASDLITAVASNIVVAGSKQYAVYGKAAGSGVTISEGFNNNGSGDIAITRSSQLFASTTAPANNVTVDLALKASVDSTTKAGVYSDTITVTCTGNF